MIQDRLFGQWQAKTTGMVVMMGWLSVVAGCGNDDLPPSSNTAPSATISAPTDGQRFKPGVALTLIGGTSDRETRDPTQLVAEWSVSGTAANGGQQVFETLSGVIDAEGRVVGSLPDGLEEGTYSVQLTVLDPSKESASSAVNISIANAPCSITLESPVSGLTTDPNVNIIFRGRIQDPDTDDPPQSLKVTLQDATEPSLYYIPATPDTGGGWNTTARFTTAGSHLVTAIGKDTAGKDCKAGPVEIKVNQCNPNDGDGDGYSSCQGDCDDTNPDQFPGSPEVCDDGLDNNCDGLEDRGWDQDKDGYEKCDPVTPDCNDEDPTVYPGAPEGCNGIDNDCVNGPNAAELDADKDGYRGCAGDCDDANGSSYPGAPEICDGKDNNCDTLVPTGERDGDDDGVRGCAEGTVPADCDDSNANISPILPENCDDTIDNNCNGQINEEVDLDSDGYTTCSDCNDKDAKINPGMAEGPPDPAVPGVPACDGIDNDCDGKVDDGTTCVDDDKDGLTELQGDCDDWNFYTYPGAPEKPDLQDNNCDGKVEGILTLDSSHVRINGDQVSGQIGYSLASGNDLNGAEPYEDGPVDDLLIGSPGYDIIFQPSQNRGAAFVLFGRSEGWKDVDGRDVSDMATTYHEEEPTSRAGFSVSMAGDLNGDGFGDFAVGAPYHSVPSASAVGRTYMVFGRAEGWSSTSLTSASLSSVEGLAAAPDSNNLLMGYSVTGGGDINGDGLDDAVFGIPWPTQSGGSGWLTLIPGRASGWSAKLKPTELTRLQGQPLHSIGMSLAMGGFNNKDSLMDFLVGSEYDITIAPGSVLWCAGDASYIQNVQFLLDNTRCREYWGKSAYEYVGDDVSGLTDVDNDGYDDFLVGRRNATDSNRFAYLIFGAELMPDSGEIDSRAQLRFTSSTDGKDECPCTVEGLPDMNGDGIGDFAVAASRSDASAKDAGRIYVFYGRANRAAWGTAFPVDISLDKADLKILGERADDNAGFDMASGDLNRDGRTDLIISATRWDVVSNGTTTSENVGRTYIVFGSPKGKNPVRP
ncbi:MAG: MopE-related protein [Myxococcota bacterium]